MKKHRVYIRKFSVNVFQIFFFDENRCEKLVLVMGISSVYSNEIARIRSNSIRFIQPSRSYKSFGKFFLVNVLSPRDKIFQCKKKNRSTSISLRITFKMPRQDEKILPRKNLESSLRRHKTVCYLVITLN